MTTPLSEQIKGIQRARKIIALNDAGSTIANLNLTSLNSNEMAMRYRANND